MSGTEAHGDDVYQPQEEAERAESQPDMQNALGEPDLDQTMDTGYSPPDRPLASTRFGTTAGEQHTGETLDQRLAQEEPEPDPRVPPGGEDAPAPESPADTDLEAADLGVADRDPAGREDSEEQDVTGDPAGDAPTAGRVRAGRLAAADEDAPSRHISVLAHDTGLNGGAASAEEAAVHVIEEEPGGGTAGG
ncbi:DUF5709 domain-containing protein [Streptomyces sp. NPDC012888]|uniref:DUF5709 domain-containing protein n=1 Tax=Streptomyces sp. NPDC012888 TaxID=3364855 RepID=UPI0036CC10F5